MLHLSIPVLCIRNTSRSKKMSKTRLQLSEANNSLRELMTWLFVEDRSLRPAHHHSASWGRHQLGTKSVTSIFLLRHGVCSDRSNQNKTIIVSNIVKVFSRGNEMLYKIFPVQNASVILKALRRTLAFYLYTDVVYFTKLLCFATVEQKINSTLLKQSHTFMGKKFSFCVKSYASTTFF